MKKLKPVFAVILAIVVLVTAGVLPAAAQESNGDGLLFGDANGDGEINAIDFACLKMYLQGMTNEFSYNKAICTMDLNGDGSLDALDLSLMKEFLLGLRSTFPVSDIVNAMPETVFEFNYTNYAWGQVNSGFYIDNSGNIHNYDNITNETNVVGTIPKAELQEKYLVLIKASFGKLTNITHGGFDMGSSTYTGYIANGTAILLKLDGDYRQSNLSPYAEELVVWMQGINKN